jgi:hypothetical protein
MNQSKILELLSAASRTLCSVPSHLSIPLQQLPTLWYKHCDVFHQIWAGRFRIGLCDLFYSLQ